MKFATMRALCRLLIVSLVLLPFQTVQAGMVGAGQVAAVATAQADRDTVMNLISRPEIASKLQSMGLNPATAKDRVAAMTDQEVRSLTGQIDSLPAGAKGNGWGWALVIVIGIVLYYNWK